MGILALEPHPRLAAPDSPPGLVSPSSSSYSSRPSPPAEKLWDARFGPVSPLMSNYEHGSAADVSTAGKGAEGGSTRKDSTQSAPRQQLPSLSSLFGPPPPLRPLHSPLTERPAPYPATSPLDRPRMPQFHNDRSYATSYFPPQESSPTMSQPRSTYDARYDHERQALHGLSRSFSGPGSPRYRESEHMRPESRSDVGLSSKWSMHHETGKHEYALVSRENQPPLRASHDRMSYQYSSNKDSGSSYRDQRSPSGPGLLQVSTSAGTTTSEGIPSKDGLGPKIWTGSHFLPRFVRAAEVPGEGMCYFYDDGSHCKTVIDGEAVNAHWGVTKAGKPRKRLAIACVTCREKKIKCDPDYPRCVQCEKFGRICKFKNAPRGGHNTSPSTPPAEPEDLRRLGGSANSNEMHHRPGSNSSASVSPRTTYRQPSPEPSMPHKRMRLGFDSYPSMPSDSSALMSRAPETAKVNAWQHRQPIELPRIHEDVLHRAWQSDPYVSDPQSVSTVISSFFVHTDSTMALCFLPEIPFKSWVTGNAHIKSPEDLMLTYSILAIGVTLSGGPRTIASEYAQVARYAQQRVTPGLQLAQARLLLAVYYISTSRSSEANDMISAAISIAIFLQLNLELDKSMDARQTTYPYGLNREGFAESRRRTYWACFVLERLNGMFPNRLGSLNPLDIFIRLPCEPDVFESQQASQAPFFPALPSSSSKMADQRLALPAYLIQLVAVWGDIMSSVYRNEHGLSSNGVPAAFVESSVGRLVSWRESLPGQFIYNPSNMDLAAQHGTLSTFLTIHLLFHHVLVKVHRHSYSSGRIPATMRMQYLSRIQEEAKQVLEITGMLEVLLQARRTPLSAPPPFMSYAVLEAADVLTAEGPLSELPGLLDQLAIASAIVEAASMVWDEARIHRSALEHRQDALRLLRNLHPEAAPPVGSKVFDNENEGQDNINLLGKYWQMEDPMNTTFSPLVDIVYTRG
ncbi:fungal-specific transcription factor [Colletotrichum godetiae]|uniref:Fungal-specific transcription factor n=1 Tax=Colletotrichum godetiae TaxID=1209918 RepID=A0AAJ0F028_9PEZI|nr:fungal-specific transcription factor [Colletotrichum godetiae]KAK1688108.1 fungal-specific transcription factor [Colletotrichum godetiae]